jgi:drug/metabolite transporter (DMT)-like permease
MSSIKEFLKERKMNNAMSYLYVLLTIIFTVYGQIMLKTRILQAGSVPIVFDEKLSFIGKLFLDPWVLSCFASAFIASLCWMMAMSRLQLSYAYPFMSLSFVFVLLLSAVFFHEPITLNKVIGLGFIIGGIVITSLG